MSIAPTPTDSAAPQQSHDTATVVVEGIVRADGTLELSEKLPLPPGKVEVTVQRLPELPKDDPFWQCLQKIWDMQKADGYVPRTYEEIQEEQRSIRETPDENAEEMERLQEAWYEERKRAGL